MISVKPKTDLRKFVNDVLGIAGHGGGKDHYLEVFCHQAYKLFGERSDEYLHFAVLLSHMN